MTTISRPTPVNKPQADLQTGGIPITVTVNGKPRTAGYAMPNHTWYRRMERSRHFWRAGGESIGASRVEAQLSLFGGAA